MHGIRPSIVRSMTFSLDDIPEELKKRIIGVDFSGMDGVDLSQPYYPGIRSRDAEAKRRAPFLRWGANLWKAGFREYEKTAQTDEVIDAVIKDVMEALGIDYVHC